MMAASIAFLHAHTFLSAQKIGVIVRIIMTSAIYQKVHTSYVWYKFVVPTR